MADRHLLLAMAELWVVELDGHPLGLDRANEIDREVVRQREAGGREAEALVDGHEAVPVGARLATRQQELRLERCLQREPIPCGLGDGGPQERARAGSPGLPIE